MKLLPQHAPGDRRKASDRRRSGRNRVASGRSAVVELTPDILRVAVLTKSSGDGPDDVAGATCAWRIEATDLRSEQARAELTVAFRKVAGELGLHGVPIHLVLAGHYSVSRVVRGPSEKVAAELKDIQSRSRLYLALGPGPKALVTRVKAVNARISHGLAVACHEHALQNVHLAAEAAGLQLEFIESELTAVARAVSRMPELPDAPYLIALVGDSRCELGVCHQGELIVDYRPGGQFGPQDLSRIVEQHCSRLERYAARFVTEGDSRVARLYIAGEAAAVATAQQSFASHLGIDVETVDADQVQATWQFADEASDGMTATALGGLLATYLPAGQRDCPNLLEHIIARSRAPLRPMLVRSLAPFAAVLALSAGLWALNLTEKNKVATQQARLDALAPAQTRANELRLQSMRDRAKLTQLELLADQLPARSGLGQIQLVANSMPDDVWLRDFVMTNLSQVAIDGASYAETGVYDFVRWLENAPGVREVALKGATPGVSDSGPVTHFILDIMLAEQAEPASEVARRE